MFRLIADVHGAVDALRRVASEPGPLLVLGDLINFIDYRTLDGIVTQLAGRELVAEIVRLRSEGSYEKAGVTWARMSKGREEELRMQYRDLIGAAYEEICAALDGADAYVTYGNVDDPGLLQRHLPAGTRYVDGDVVELDGLRIGIAGGGTKSPLGVAGEVSDEEMAAKLAGLGPVDVLCTHVPPAIDALSRDVIGGREKGSQSTSRRRCTGASASPGAAMSATSGRPAAPWFMADVDLEALAAGYAHRPASAESIRRFGAAWDAAGAAPGELAVDIGGGLGRQAEEWASRGARALVVDPAQGMVAAAAERPRVAAVRARAEALPLADGSAALVSFEWSLHHTDWPRAIGEAVRILRAGGRIEIANPGPGDTTRSHLVHWFPAMNAVDTARFPDPDEVARRLVQSGLELVLHEPIVQQIERRAGDWTAAVEAGFVSTLQLIPPDEVAAGLVRFRERYPDPDEIVRYQLHYRRLAATLPR
jgi:ubiquinone/menaquinone biosynthesis C-methylase UbiE/Icc-related predicted phosphoesterase